MSDESKVQSIRDALVSLLKVKNTNQAEKIASNIVNQMDLTSMKAFADAMAEGTASGKRRAIELAKQFYLKTKNARSETMEARQMLKTIKENWQKGQRNAVVDTVRGLQINEWNAVWPLMGRGMLIDLMAHMEARGPLMEDFDRSGKQIAEAIWGELNPSVEATTKFHIFPLAVSNVPDRKSLMREGYNFYAPLASKSVLNKVIDILEANSIDYFLLSESQLALHLPGDLLESINSSLGSLYESAGLVNEATDEDSINAPNWPTDDNGVIKGDPMSTDYGKYTVDNDHDLGGEFKGETSVDAINDGSWPTDDNGVIKGEPMSTDYGKYTAKTGGQAVGGSSGETKSAPKASEPKGGNPFAKKEEPAEKTSEPSEPKADKPKPSAPPFQKKEEPKEESKAEDKDDSEEKKEKVEEARKVGKEERRAKRELDAHKDRDPIAKAANDLQFKKGGPMDTAKGDKGYRRKEKHQKKDMDEAVSPDYQIGDMVEWHQQTVEVKVPNGPDGTIGIIHEGRLRMVESKDVSPLTEGVMGMTNVPAIRRLRELAGLSPMDDTPVADPNVDSAMGDVSIGDDFGDDEIPGEDDFGDPMSGGDMGADLGGDMGDDMGGDMGADLGGDSLSGLDAEPDDSLGFDAGIDAEVGDDPMATAAVPGMPAAPNAAMGAPMAGSPTMGGMAPSQSDAYSQIEDHLNQVQSLLSDVRMAEYRTVVRKLENLANQIKLMGRDFLGESKKG